MINKIFHLLILFGFVTMMIPAHAQDITTEGRDFWFGFMENNAGPGQPVELKVYISALDSTGGKIEIPRINWSQDFSVLANSTTLIVIPTNLAMALGSGTKENKGIHITSGANISVYALNSRIVSADASVILPTPALGTTYYISSYMGLPPSQFSEFMLVGSEDNTEVEITPTVATTDGHATGVAYKVTLLAGQAMQVQAAQDLTGTKISTTGSCKPFAVFSGNKWTNVGECGAAQDHLYEQLFPVSTWGKNYATVPYRGRTGGDVFKIVASENSTTVNISGLAPIVLDKGKFTTKLITTASTITADKPIQVAQLSRSQSCDNQPGDPFMIMLSPLEQALTKITFNAFNVTVIQNYYTNIITPTAAIADLRLDGTNIASQFAPFPTNPTYSFARVSIANGNHTIESLAGFSAYVYGFGNIESFGYATGAKLDNLNMTITSTKKSTNEKTTTICAGDAVMLDVVAKRSFTKFTWNFGGAIKNGIQTEYTFANAGTYFISVTGTNESDNCADSETATIRINVVKPNERVRGPSSVCPFDSGVPYFVRADLTNTYKWFVNGGTIAAIPSKDTIIINWSGTSDQARVRLLTTDKQGCVGDTTALSVRINVKLEPILPIGLDSICSSNITDVEYSVYKNPTSIYTWSLAHGNITSGQGNNEMTVTWNGPGLAKISYLEESTVNTICSGKSDTLTIFIEREPIEALDIQLPKKIFQIDEPIQFEFTGDPLFQFKSWDFGNGVTVDSVKKESLVKYGYPCPGTYPVQVTAYTGTVCQNTGTGDGVIEILNPELALQVVSHHFVKDSTIEISTTVKNADFHKGDINLQQRIISPAISNWSVVAKNQRTGIFEVGKLNTKANVYEYRSIIPSLCTRAVESLPHNSIRLRAELDTTSEIQKVNLSRNDYKNWNGGVAQYELWVSVDGQGLTKITNDIGNSATDLYGNIGFRYCYRVKAVENGGTRVSWSNVACVDFIPKIELYNVITPNEDTFNEFFVIKGIENYPNSTFSVFNRYGSLVYKSVGYHNHWNGTDQHGKELSAGTYYYLLDLNDERSERRVFRGVVSVVR